MAKNKNNYDQSGDPVSFFSGMVEDLNVEELYTYYFNSILRKLYSMIDISGLPDSINETYLKQALFLHGKVGFFRDDGGQLRALVGNYASTPDIYYIPEEYIIVNPKLRKSYQLTIGKDVTIVYNSDTDVYNIGSYRGGLYLLIKRTSRLLADNDISINVAQKNSRMTVFVTADFQNEKKSAEMVLDKIYSGQPAVVAQSNIAGNINVVPVNGSSNSQIITQLIELQQYILASFYSEIGLAVNNNMKKAVILEDEINKDENVVRVNIEDILRSWQKGFEEVNTMFGTSISCELNKVYKTASEAEDLTEDEPEETIEDTSEAEPAAAPEDPTEETEPEKPSEEDSEEEEPQEEETEEETEEASEAEEPKPEETSEEDSEEEEPQEEETEEETEEASEAEEPKPEETSEDDSEEEEPQEEETAEEPEPEEETEEPSEDDSEAEPTEEDEPETIEEAAEEINKDLEDFLKLVKEREKE